MIEWVKFFISVSLGLQYQKIPAFRQLTKSVEVYLTAETGQFRQLIWFARMTLAAKIKDRFVLIKSSNEPVVTAERKD